MNRAALAEMLEKIIVANAKVESRKTSNGILVTAWIEYEGGSIVCVYDLSTILGDRALEGRVEGHEVVFNLTALKMKFAKEYIKSMKPKRAKQEAV